MAWHGVKFTPAIDAKFFRLQPKGVMPLKIFALESFFPWSATAAHSHSCLCPELAMGSTVLRFCLLTLYLVTHSFVTEVTLGCKLNWGSNPLDLNRWRSRILGFTLAALLMPMFLMPYLLNMGGWRRHAFRLFYFSFLHRFRKRHSCTRKGTSQEDQLACFDTFKTNRIFIELRCFQSASDGKDMVEKTKCLEASARQTSCCESAHVCDLLPFVLCRVLGQMLDKRCQLS